MTSFEKSVLRLTKSIKRGKITTYKEIAKKLGRPLASRAVGNALRKNPCPFDGVYPERSRGTQGKLIKIPCHRVVKSDGSLGGYKDGSRKKKRLLEREGIKIRGNKINNFKKFLITNF